MSRHVPLGRSLRLWYLCLPLCLIVHVPIFAQSAQQTSAVPRGALSLCCRLVILEPEAAQFVRFLARKRAFPVLPTARHGHTLGSVAACYQSCQAIEKHWDSLGHNKLSGSLIYSVLEIMYGKVWKCVCMGKADSKSGHGGFGIGSGP